MRFRPIPSPCAPIPLGEFLTGEARFPAVYFLLNRGEIVYVGQSKTLRLRIENHLTDGVKLFDAVAYVRCTIDQLMRIESHYIREYVPKYNDCAVAKKARTRLSWNESRRPHFKESEDIGNFEIVDAENCVILPINLGEFFRVAESDAVAWDKSGRIKDYTIPGLLNWMMRNSHEVQTAQEKYEQL